MEKLTFEQFFNDVPLYCKKRFIIYAKKDNQYSKNDEGLKEFLSTSGLLGNKIESLCNVCKKRYPFSYKIESLFSSRDTLYFALDSKNNLISYIEPYTNTKTFRFPNSFNADEISERNVAYLKYFLECTGDGTSYSLFVRLEQENGVVTMMKIGQFPSNVDIQGIDFDCYKKVLERFDTYSDYRRAYFSYLDSLYAGSFAYLRRVFEKMINLYCKEITLKDNHVETRIEACKDKISPEIYDLMKNLYSILSVSIHELDEDESKSYFESLKAVIEMQLEYEKTNIEKEETNKRLHSKLSAIREGIELKKK
ncbi:MAG: hypothetical protein PHS54_05880 [Clostridia bacterium]|nr:hypothetical protein [Clostridia bacterium]